MRRIFIVFVALLTATAFATAAFAAKPSSGGGNPHFVGDVNFTDNGTTLTASGTIAGLGNLDTVILISGSGVPTVTCTNSGGNEAPGQNPATLNFGGGTQVDSSQINGNYPFSVTSSEPVPGTPKQSGCPNNKSWTVTITDVDFQSATIQFFQGEGCTLEGGQPSASCSQVISQTFQL